MGVIIKISLVLSTENNVVEYHRVLPQSYFNGCKVDLFTKEIESLREEARAKKPKLKKHQVQLISLKCPHRNWEGVRLVELP